MKLFKNKRIQFFKHNLYSPGATSHGSLGEIGVRSIKQILLAVRYKIFYTYLPIRLWCDQIRTEGRLLSTSFVLKSSMSVNFDHFDYMRSPRKLCYIHSRTYAT